MIIALIPVKKLSQAKARLAPVLDDAGRRDLVVAMLRDVLAAAMGCDALDGATVVSRDEMVLSIARGAGAEGLAGRGTPSASSGQAPSASSGQAPSASSGQAPSASSGQALNEALTAASERLRARGAERLLVLAGDLPLADAESIASVVQADADVAVVPSRDGGTNALLLSPGAIAFAFGPDSARKHLAAAEAAGLRSLRLEVPALALDIDTPDDLERLRTADDIGAHTRAALERLGLLHSPARRN